MANEDTVLKSAQVDERVAAARRWVAEASNLALTDDRVIVVLADRRDQLMALLERADDMLRFYNSEGFEHHDRRKWLADFAIIVEQARQEPPVPIATSKTYSCETCQSDHCDCIGL